MFISQCKYFATNWYTEILYRPLLLDIRVEELIEIEDGAPVVAFAVDVGVLKSWCWALLMGDGAKLEENISLMADVEDVLTVSVSFSRVSALVLVLLLGETLTEEFTVSLRSVSALVLLVRFTVSLRSVSTLVVLVLMSV